MSESQTVLHDLRDEAQALSEMQDEGLNRPEDLQAWEELKNERQAKYEEVKEEVGKVTARSADADRQYRIDSQDHNAR